MKTAFQSPVIGKKFFATACLLMLSLGWCVPSAQAQAPAPTRLIVRDSLGLPGINFTCVVLGCNVVRGLGDPQGQLFLITFPPILNPVTSLLRLNLESLVSREDMEARRDQVLGLIRA